MTIIQTTVERLENACILHKCESGRHRPESGFVIWLHDGGCVETITSIEVTDGVTKVYFATGMAQYPKNVIPVRIFTEMDLHGDDL